MADIKATIKPVKQKRDWSAEGDLPYDRIPAFKAAYDCYKNAAATWNVSGNNGIPSGWTVNTYTP